MGEETIAESAPDIMDSSDGVSAQAEGTGALVPRGLRLTKIAGTHFLVFLLALSLFAAADSWSTVTGLGIARFLCVVTGVLAGITITTLVHEWFHYLGARFSSATYDIPDNLGLFVYDWDFNANNLHQFIFMSVAGSVGGVVAIVLLWNSVPADSWGRAALHGGALASFIFGACVEWPVLRRTRESKDPLAELSKINGSVLTRSFVIASLAGVVMTLLLSP